MTKNLWERERQNTFRSLVKQYLEEGYDNKEAKKLARSELNEVMEDREDFVKNIWKETYSDD